MSLDFFKYTIFIYVLQALISSQTASPDNTVPIVGGVVGVLVAAVVILIVVFMIRRRRYSLSLSLSLSRSLSLSLSVTYINMIFP